ncbi:murein L,D-transpeptidase family protein [Pseudorhodobacter sp.]|uniref:L,D-transpeptidase family protein n=1 Tax=Pseudorhodobacter sp. TaxID=1934400 RepID=UPI00264A180B|nr:L,D-transpeptidase family protein [Pseudorhodobacter sp.]MDN5785982.1 L,D-transpeptidase family protein [Pseudorhodobacter sp.]
MKILAAAYSALVLLVLIVAVVLIVLVRPMPSVPDHGPLTGPVDLIVVEKAARRMVLYRDGVSLRSYRIALGFAAQGDKLRQGDGRTPEGIFHINRRNESSAYHLSLGLDYPRPVDSARAAAGGYDPGGDIFFHGQPNGFPDAAMVPGDWTAGCIALSNAEMREIWPVVAIGTKVEIMP